MPKKSKNPTWIVNVKNKKKTIKSNETPKLKINKVQ